MDLTQGNLLLLYGLVVILVVIGFLLIRRSQRRIKKVDGRADAVATTHDFKVDVTTERTARPTGWDTYRPRRSLEVQHRAALETSESIYFNWNGHTWDAYEVFGISPANSSDEIDEAYRRASANADDESQAFLRAAYDAILKV